MSEKPIRAARLSDVARLAKVSTATVSRALSLPHKVKARTLERVRQAASSLGYVAHGAARALASRRTQTIAAVVPTLDNAIFANTIHALQRRLDEAGYMLLLASHEFDPGIETRVTRALIERGVDGLVLLGTTHHPDIYRMIEAHALPYVLTWAWDERGNHPCVGFDNHAAARRITEYLLELGHRRFAMVSGVTVQNERAQERLAGVRAALAARGLALPAQRLVEKAYTHTGGREGLREVIAGAEPPTAVICGNDVLAIGAIAECHALGLKVPEDVSVTGFDDMELAAMVNPALTTMRFPTAELGSYAADHLLRRLRGQVVDLRRKLPTELVVRDSAAAPKTS
ncbi:MAG: LacI family DNA-binding transcriptional regulator [Betaproteobacteria bacterium]|jgi:LacI family transcriptional regulator|nr:LacI family DNA-binding transcriptional regulator [Betaproteobacteria bacterium]